MLLFTCKSFPTRYREIDHFLRAVRFEKNIVKPVKLLPRRRLIGLCLIE